MTITFNTFPSFALATFALLLLAMHHCIQASNAQLEVGFYRNSCPSAEFIVKNEVRRAFFRDRGLAAGLVMMHFHDCFVRGCDGSVLIDSTPSNQAEKDALANNSSLRGFQVINNAKSLLEFACPRTVSCADILAFAARDSVEMTGGFHYNIPAGRRDERVSSANEASVNLPGPSLSVDQLTKVFTSKGLRQDEMVTLSGAHTIGRSHCSSFSSRLFSFNTTTSQDPSLDPVYASRLRLQCPQGAINPSTVVPMDPSSPTFMDTSYYNNVLNNRSLFTSDQTLLTNPATANEVVANSQDPSVWGQKFAAAMVKMGQIGVLTGDAGEIRVDCRVVN